MTNKQIRIHAYVSAHPGCSTADVHRAIGGDYAHGHHRFTYASVDRLCHSRRGTGLVRGPSRGNAGSLYTREQLAAVHAISALVAAL